ncbi:MAG: pilus assembly protein [Chloroflexi bacterium]|nr:MAG: pilus assembly protein [Chloroflexota bacterium]MBL1194371.1 pilus assembly protein [Chloroflexota bacterium]NOH11659.1 pilus assembly protein [Chloroflexota bacterium]
MKSLLRLKNVRGQAMAEFAIVFLILMIIIMGAIDFTRLFVIYSSVSAGAREGSRFGSVTGGISDTSPYLDCAGIRAVVVHNAGLLVDLEENDIAITYDNGDKHAHIGVCGSVTEEDIELGDRIVVTVTETYLSITPLGLPPLPVSFSSARTIYVGGIAP